MFARMPRYTPAPSGTRATALMWATGQNGNSRHTLTLFDSSSRMIIEFRSGLLIRRFGSHSLAHLPPRYIKGRAVCRAELRYFCAMTSRYSGWCSQGEHGRTRADATRRRCTRPAAGCANDIRPGVPCRHGIRGAGPSSARSPKRRDHATWRPHLKPERATTRPVRGRPWKRRRCAPTVLTVQTDRPNSTDARPPCVRGHRNMAVYGDPR
jgi:hypothetical protein